VASYFAIRAEMSGDFWSNERMTGKAMLVICAIVVVTHDELILDFARQPFRGDVIDVAGTAAHDLDLVGIQYVDRALAHVACEHDLNAHIGKDWADIRFATATFGGIHGFLVDDLVVIIQSEDGVVIAMAEMVVDVSVAGGKCNFHYILLNDI